MASSYFSAAGFNPMKSVQRLFNPYRHHDTVNLRGEPLTLFWTERANQAQKQHGAPMAVELQLYFSCVVKKLVYFDAFSPTDNEVAVGDKFLLRFRVVESDVCSPETFAEHYPERRDLCSPQAQRMHPKTLYIDYVDGDWQGRFSL